MAVVTLSASLAGLPVPLSSLAGATRLPGSGTSTGVTLSLPGGTLTLTGTGLTYDGEALPAGGVITAMAFRADGTTLAWSLASIALAAEALRAAPASLDILLFSGADTLLGAAGGDILLGHAGNDTIAGGGGSDRLDGGSGADSLVGGAGNDTYVLEGADTVVEADGGGIDLVESASARTLGSWVENLRLTGTAAVNGIGNALGNTITGNVAANVLHALGGDDTVAGGAGDDSLRGGFGRDRLVGGPGADSLLGEADDDTLFGSDGDDVLDGGAGADSIRGETGDDTVLAGGFGADRMDLGAGDDLLVGRLAAGSVAEGGTGTDTLRVAGSLVDATVTGFEVLAWADANEAIHLTAGQFAAFATLRGAGAGGPSRQVIEAVGGGELGLDAIAYDLAPGEAVELRLDGAASWAVHGRDTPLPHADDIIVAGEGDDTIYAFGGDDDVQAGGGDNVLVAGAGNDIVAVGAGNNFILLGDGDDLVRVETPGGTPVAGSNTIDAGAGNDTFLCHDGDDFIFGNTGDDRIVTGGGIDDIYGGSGNDTIFGQAGGDLLTGGRGADLLVGGAGLDTFGFDDGDSGLLPNGAAGGIDTITDFRRVDGDLISVWFVDANTAVPGDQAFTEVLDSASPMPVGAGSLRYELGPGATTISGSVDADADFEFIVVVKGAGFVPVLSDFIL